MRAHVLNPTLCALAFALLPLASRADNVVNFICEQDAHSIYRYPVWIDMDIHVATFEYDSFNKAYFHTSNATITPDQVSFAAGRDFSGEMFVINRTTLSASLGETTLQCQIAHLPLPVSQRQF